MVEWMGPGVEAAWWPIGLRATAGWLVLPGGGSPWELGNWRPATISNQIRTDADKGNPTV